MTAARDRLQFTGASGAMLAARLHRPAGDPVAYALFAHCFTCTKDLTAAVQIADTLAAAGIAVMRFDFTGLGESEGEFASTNFTSNVDDLVAAAAFLGEQYTAPALLVGHSLGGAAALLAAAKLPSVRAVVTIAAPSSPEHALGLIEDARATVEADGVATVRLAGREFSITSQLLSDLRSQRLLDMVRALEMPLLVCHSPADKVVDIGHAQSLFRAARHPKSYLSLDNADHLLSRKEDAAYAATVIAAWAGKFLGAEQAARVAPAPVEEGVVDVALTSEGFATDIRLGTHYLRADEPVSVGGSNTGPAPYDLLLASLGACTAMTLRMYANRKQLALDAVRVVLRHEKVHAVDCGDCESTTGKIDMITRDIYLEGNLDDTQRKRLGEIADMCPVHRTLHGEIKVRTNVRV